VTEIILSQAEADALLQLEKHRVDDSRYDYPGLGGSLRIPLLSVDRRENFSLDVTKSRVYLEKGTYQNRARGVVILARLDFGGAPHRNPDDEEIECPHLHLYREGFGDRWAFPVPEDQFRQPADRFRTLLDFMRFVNITRPPQIDPGLFA
jgi:hypothetical protein